MAGRVKSLAAFHPRVSLSSSSPPSATLAADETQKIREQKTLTSQEEEENNSAIVDLVHFLALSLSLSQLFLLHVTRGQLLLRERARGKERKSHLLAKKGSYK